MWAQVKVRFTDLTLKKCQSVSFLKFFRQQVNIFEKDKIKKIEVCEEYMFKFKCVQNIH